MNALEERLQQVEALVGDLERSDPRARESAQELVRTLLDLHQAGLSRMLDVIGASGDAGRVLLTRFAGDDLIAGLLLLHGLHPVDLQTRITKTLASLDASLVGIDDGKVTVRLHSRRGAMAARRAIETALFNAAPDMVALEFEAAPDEAVVGFVPLDQLRRSTAYP